MLNFTNPTHGDTGTQGGKSYKYDGASKAWNVVSSIVPDNTGSITTSVSKIWTGTQAEFLLLSPTDDVVYLVKD